MNNHDRRGQVIVLIGRILLGLIFLKSGLSKIGDWEGTVGHMVGKGMPLASFFLLGAIILEIGGSLSMMFGFNARFGAVALLAFLIPATLIFHNFWALEGMEAKKQLSAFMKNLSIMGGLLIVSYFGSGPLSIDYLIKKE
jgi:putative oxidoreductase